MAILNILISSLFISFILGELPKFKLLGSASIGPVDIIVFFLFVFWSLKVKKSKKYILEKPIIIFLIAGAFSLLINLSNYTLLQLFVSFSYLFRWGLYASMYFVVKDIGREQEKNFFKYSTLTAGLLVVLGLLQFIFFPSLISWYHLGWDKHLYRIFSTFLDPNFTGIIFVLFFVFLFHFRERIFKNNKNFEFVSLALSFISIILTYSRGAILMLAVCSFAYSLLKKNKKFFIATALGIAAFFVILIPGFYLENTNLLRTNSVLERIGTAQKGIQIFKNRPLGIGFDAYRYAREKYGEIDLQLAGASHAGAGIDNSFIFVLVTAGIPGFLAYLFLLLKMFKLGLEKRGNRYGFVLVVSLAGLVVNSLTINSLFYSYIMLWIWAIAGLTESN